MHAFVVGGSSGIGLQISIQLAQSMPVTSVARRHYDFEQSQYPLTSISTDIRDTSQLASEIISQSHSPLAIVFSQRYRGEDYADEMNVMLSSPIKIIDSIYTYLKPGSKIIFIGSVAGSSVISNQPALYHATRSALEGLVRYYSVSFAPLGIEVYCVNPTTAIKESNQDYFQSHPSILKEITSSYPAQAIPTSIDIAQAVSTLVVHMNRFASGSIINIDGAASLVYGGK